MFDFLNPFAKFAKPVAALGFAVSIVSGFVPRLLVGQGTVLSGVLVLLGLVLGVLLLKSEKSQPALVAMLVLLALSLVFPVSNDPVPAVKALNASVSGAVAADAEDVVPVVSVRLIIALLATFVAPAAGILSMKEILYAAKKN